MSLVLAILLLMVVLGMPGATVGMSLTAVSLIWLAFWLVQFLDLMASPTHRFPGPYDKPIWAAVFIFLFPVAPVAFWIWKNTIERPAH
ncbi:hypothetical protein ACERK3_06100 [Phycisphaerales bacterium AB-hyl4]|uniref:Phospholipase D-like protein n=1 Tax=Natronomicrosphaera hydrolytica TaxID=3242702 RepID=A0ABV4U552_9BACT